VIARAVSVVLGIALVGCMKEYADPVTDSDVLAALSICPDSEPVVGSGCVDRVDPSNGKSLTPHCEYGSNADLGCNSQIACSTTFGATWSVIPSQFSLGCATNQCPRSHTEITDGAPCEAPLDAYRQPMSQYVCGYAEGTCGCMGGATGFAWKCVGAPPSPCPSTRPNIGSQCDKDDLACDYGACAFEHSAAMVCASKRWHLAAVTCN
jgi:hypothetical protein